MIAAVIVATAIRNYREIDTRLTAETLSTKATVAELSAITLSEKFGRIKDIGVSLAGRPMVRKLVAEGKWIEAIGYLEKAPQDLPHIARLFLTDTRGILQADAPALPGGVRGTDFSYREWFKGVTRDWQPYITSAYVRKAIPQRNVLAMSTPIRAPTGDVAGILVLQIHIKTLVDWVRTDGAGPAGFVYVVDSKQQIVFDSRFPDRAGVVNISQIPVMQKLQWATRNAEIMVEPGESEEVIVAHSPVPDHNWHVVVQQPTRASLGLAARDKQLHQLLTGYVLILALSAAGIFLASRMADVRRRAANDRRMKIELEQRVAERTAELEVANQELEAFSYSVSHDLRAPLRAIDGFSQILLEDYLDRLDDSGQQYLNRVRAGSQRMAALIDDMLQLSRVSRTGMNRTVVDLSTLAESLVSELRNTDRDRQVTIDIQPGLNVEGDPNLLRILLTNMLSNAWKFTTQQAAAHIELGRRDSDGESEFYVRDNGVGFDMTYAGKLFGAFQRLHSEKEFPGTGIGLATVQRIVRRHGGQVRAESTVNQGATFYFTLSAFNHA